MKTNGQSLMGSTVVLTLLAVAQTQTACAQVSARQIARNTAKIKTYAGQVVEQGVLDQQAMTSTIFFKNPTAFHAQVTQPKSLAGISVLYNDNVLTFYYPNYRYAIRFKNLAAPSEVDRNKIITDNYRKGLRQFNYSLFSSSRIAGLRTIGMRHRARTRRTYNRSGYSQVYSRYSFPLAGEFRFKGGARYAFRYKSITFNRELPAGAFKLALPAGTIISDWDLKSSPIDLAAARKSAGFKIALPTNVPLGLKRITTVRQKGPIPAFTTHYRRGPYFLLASAANATGMSVVPYGVPVSTAHKGRLVITGSLSSYSFVHGGTYYVLLGNLPFEEILAFSSAIGSASRP
jgi:outer membrane lipoprotein-sorting protein